MRGSEISCQRLKSEGVNGRVAAPAQPARTTMHTNPLIVFSAFPQRLRVSAVNSSRYNITSMPFQEVVEAEGHLIDSHIMENIFDKVVEHSGRFEVEQFRIGRTNSEPSYLRLKVETPDQALLERLLHELLSLGCAPAESGDAALATVERDRCAPEDFYSTTNHRTYVRSGQQW